MVYKGGAIMFIKEFSIIGATCMTALATAVAENIAVKTGRVEKFGVAKERK